MEINIISRAGLENHINDLLFKRVGFGSSVIMKPPVPTYWGWCWGYRPRYYYMFSQRYREMPSLYVRKIEYGMY